MIILVETMYFGFLIETKLNKKELHRWWKTTCPTINIDCCGGFGSFKHVKTIFENIADKIIPARNIQTKYDKYFEEAIVGHNKLSICTINEWTESECLELDGIPDRGPEGPIGYENWPWYWPWLTSDL
jgi:hypothetical protein